MRRRPRIPCRRWRDSGDDGIYPTCRACGGPFWSPYHPVLEGYCFAGECLSGAAGSRGWLTPGRAGPYAAVVLASPQRCDYLPFDYWFAGAAAPGPFQF